MRRQMPKRKSPRIIRFRRLGLWPLRMFMRPIPSPLFRARSTFPAWTMHLRRSWRECHHLRFKSRAALIRCFRRLQKIARVREVVANRYSLMNIPRNAEWGRGPRTEKILCLSGKPLLIWSIARARSLWFFDRNGDPHLRVNLGYTLHSDQERAKVAELFAYARPRPGTWCLRSHNNLDVDTDHALRRLGAGHGVCRPDLQSARKRRILRHGMCIFRYSIHGTDASTIGNRFHASLRCDEAADRQVRYATNKPCGYR